MTAAAHQSPIEILEDWKQGCTCPPDNSGASHCQPCMLKMLRRLERALRAAPDLERSLSACKASRGRVVRAHNLLKHVKSMTSNAEPAVLKARMRLRSLPEKIGRIIDPKNPEGPTRHVQRELGQLIRDIDEWLQEARDDVQTPALAAYIQAEQELEESDLLEAAAG
jgi:hypothetical protein